MECVKGMEYIECMEHRCNEICYRTRDGNIQRIVREMKYTERDKIYRGRVREIREERERERERERETYRERERHGRGGLLGGKGGGCVRWKGSGDMEGMGQVKN
jgi:hypothetical protein